MNRQGITDLSLISRIQQSHRKVVEIITVSSAAKVLMIGPSLREEGGIGRVSTLILNHVNSAELSHISSWNNIPNSTELPNKFGVVVNFVVAWLKLLFRFIINDFDILHCHMAERGSAWRTSIFAITAYIFRKPVVIHTHGAEFHQFYAGLPYPLQKLLKVVFQKASCLIALSSNWQQYYIEQFDLPQQRVRLMYNPVEYPLEVLAKKDALPLKLLFLGKIDSRKGIYDLLESLAELRHHWHIDLKLLLAGSGEIASVIKRAEELDIASAIDVLGWIGLDEKNKRLAEANCFVLPSYNEGLPMALLEAMSYGLPIITTPVGGIGEVIEDGQTGLLVEPGNISQLTDALKLIIGDRNLRDRLGKSARVKAQEFTVERYTESLSDLYQQLQENYCT